MEGPSLVESLTPRSRAQWIVLAVAVVFLAVAGGYAIRAFAEPDPRELSSTDEAFLIDMIDHHDQAVEMGLIAQERAADPSVRAFATEVVVQQRWEIGVMEALLGSEGLTRGTDPGRLAMAWMGHAPMPASEMPGMATAAELEELRAASPEDVDRLFLELMTTHHQAGVEMAETAVELGSNDYVRELAAGMARVQESEITEYGLLLDRLSASAG